jgi:GTP-binding protein
MVESIGSGLNNMEANYLFAITEKSQVSKEISGGSLREYDDLRVAMVGRSNVGKSTLINSILERRIAQISSKPGKTRAIHFYHVPKKKRIFVDLPGYGFAHASKEDRSNWGKFIEAYLKADENLERLIVIMDARHGPQKVDIEALTFFAKLGVRMSFVFNKIDAIRTQSLKVAAKRDVKEFLKESSLLAPLSSHWVSATDGEGIRELRQALFEGDEIP